MTQGALRRWAKTLVGSGLDILRPQIGAEIEAASATGASLRLKKWVLHARLEKARLRGDAAAVERLLHLFWQGETSADFYRRYTHRFEDWFLGPHQEIVAALAVAAADGRSRQLVEVGCGDGRVLAHLATRLPDVRRFVGVDINPAVIDHNRRTYARDGRLSFVAGNASDVLDGMIADGTILMTYGGVMEYFREAELSRIFARLAGLRHTMVAAVEPVDPAHDLGRVRRSYSFGAENSFSHNHRHLLETAGFGICHHREMTFGGVRWILVLARRR